MLLGCIGDDFTGSSDLANTLAKQGMRTVQYTGTPDTASASDVEAGVVALKSRSVAADEAVKLSLDALHWLQAQGCSQFFFKYCSTFDSTPDGNIGPVIDALAAELDAYQIVVCPAFPGTGRSIYQGHLFVNDVLLSESGMQNHPLTPMTDPDIRRCLAAQTKNTVGHIAADAVFAGVESTIAAMQQQHQAGNRLLVVDALQDQDLMVIGKACESQPLVTGGSGMALGLPANFASKKLLKAGGNRWQSQTGKCVVLSGSCSSATREQVALHKQYNPAFEIVAERVIEGALSVDTVARFLVNSDKLPLAYSSADPEEVKSVQAQYGRERAANALESFFADVARWCVTGGVTGLITAGGETSGAVIEGLGLNSLEIGPEIDPGVPALRAGSELVIALKSGNFGAPDFFSKAAGVLMHA